MSTKSNRREKDLERFTRDLSDFLRSSLTHYAGATTGKNADHYLEVNMTDAWKFYKRACRLTGQKP